MSSAITERRIDTMLSFLYSLLRGERDIIKPSENDAVYLMYYRLIIKDTPKRLIDVPKVSLTAKLEDPPEGLFTDEIYMEYEGEQVFDGLNLEEMDSFLDIIAGKKSSYRIPRFDGTWYAVEDANGTKHIASIGDDHSVYASFTFESGEMDSGLIVFDENGNAKNIVVDNKPIDIDSIIGSVSVELMNSPKAPMLVPISMPLSVKAAPSYAGRGQNTSRETSTR